MPKYLQFSIIETQKSYHRQQRSCYSPMLTCFEMQCFLFWEGHSLLPTLTSSWRTVSLLEDSAPPSHFLSHFPGFPHTPKQTGSHPSSCSPVQMDLGALSILYYNRFCSCLSPQSDGEQLSSFYLISLSSVWHTRVAQFIFIGGGGNENTKKLTRIRPLPLLPRDCSIISQSFIFIMELLDGNP